MSWRYWMVFGIQISVFPCWDDWILKLNHVWWDCEFRARWTPPGKDLT